MNAVTGLGLRSSFVAPISRVEANIPANDFARPTLVIDVDAVERQFRALSAGEDTGPCVLARPSCDSADVM